MSSGRCRSPIAEHIATFDPPTVKAMLERDRQSEEGSFDVDRKYLPLHLFVIDLKAMLDALAAALTEEGKPLSTPSRRGRERRACFS